MGLAFPAYATEYYSCNTGKQLRGIRFVAGAFFTKVCLSLGQQRAGNFRIGCSRAILLDGELRGFFLVV